MKNDYYNKYKWHDLRKDSNDLPEDGEEVLIISQYEIPTSANRYDLAHFTNDLYEIDNSSFCEYEGTKTSGFYKCYKTWDFYDIYEIAVTAWKHIEPFESEE